jgi:hypothetical protein
MKLHAAYRVEFHRDFCRAINFSSMVGLVILKGLFNNTVFLRNTFGISTTVKPSSYKHIPDMSGF